MNIVCCRRVGSKEITEIPNMSLDILAEVYDSDYVIYEILPMPKRFGGEYEFEYGKHYTFRMFEINDEGQYELDSEFEMWEREQERVISDNELYMLEKVG
jgi:hypothetical protein